MADTTLERHQSEAARLQRELDAAEKEQPTDSRGLRDQRERIGKLTDDFRQTLRAIREIEKGATSAASPQPPTMVKTGKMQVIGPEGQESFEQTSPAQAEYDWRAAQAEYARHRQAALDAITRDKANADEEWRKLSAIRESLALRLQQSDQALKARDQDLDAAVASQGHRVSHANAMAPYLAPAGSGARLDHLIKTGSLEGAPPVQPLKFADAQQALTQTPTVSAPPAAIPDVAPAYDQAQQQYQQRMEMIMGGRPRYVMGG